MPETEMSVQKGVLEKKAESGEFVIKESWAKSNEGIEYTFPDSMLNQLLKDEIQVFDADGRELVGDEKKQYLLKSYSESGLKSRVASINALVGKENNTDDMAMAEAGLQRRITLHSEEPKNDQEAQQAIDELTKTYGGRIEFPNFDTKTGEPLSPSQKLNTALHKGDVSINWVGVAPEDKATDKEELPKSQTGISISSGDTQEPKTNGVDKPVAPTRQPSQVEQRLNEMTPDELENLGVAARTKRLEQYVGYARENLSTKTADEIRQAIGSISLPDNNLKSRLQSLCLFGRSAKGESAFQGVIQNEASSLLPSSKDEGVGVWKSLNALVDGVSGMDVGVSNTAYVLREQFGEAFKSKFGEYPRTEEEQQELAKAKARAETIKDS